jgi:two-component system LytT family response regulator
VSVEGEPPILICQTLGSYADTLPNPPFLRLDRSLIVNTDRVESIQSISGGGAEVRLAGVESSARLGRTALRRLKAVTR